MTSPTFPAISVWQARLRAGLARVVVRARRPLLLATCSSLVALGSPASAQLPPAEAASWGFFAYTPDLSDGLTGAGLARHTAITWTRVEPVPGSEVYTWDFIDDRVRRAQAAGRNVVLELKTGNGPSFSEVECLRAVDVAEAAGLLPSGRELSSCPVLPLLEAAWSKMVTEVVERYDGDGDPRDMPGLVENFRVDIEIENEAANPEFWDNGTPDRTLAADRYLHHLELSHKAARAANLQTKVILTGTTEPNRLALCDREPVPPTCSAFTLASLAFAKRILGRPDIFDAVDVHFFVYYRFEPTFIDEGFQWVVDQIPPGHERPIYALEWTGSSLVHLNSGLYGEFINYFPYAAHFASIDVFQAMYLALDQPENVAYRLWFEAEQATEFGKLFTNLLARGISRLVHVQYSDYHDGAEWSSPWWNWQGIIKYAGDTPIRKPSYYTYNILSERIAGFTGVRRIDLGDVRLYEFTFPTGEPTYVLWTDGASTVLDLSSVIPRNDLLVTHLVTQLDATGAPVVRGDQAVPTTAVPVGDVPVLLSGNVKAASQITMYRLYADNLTFEHLYTTDLNEYDTLGAAYDPVNRRGWLQEGVAFRLLDGSGGFGGAFGIPLYRLYNTALLQHHWTTDFNEVSVLSAYRDWNYEGIVGYLLPEPFSGVTPLYRLWDRGALHLWTTDENEKNILSEERGWAFEGVIGNVIP